MLWKPTAYELFQCIIFKVNSYIIILFEDKTHYPLSIIGQNDMCRKLKKIQKNIVTTTAEI